MRRNLTAALFEHETICTTLQKAKDVKSFAEKLITLAKKGTLAARRRAISLLGNRDLWSEKDDELIRGGTIIGRLFSEIGPQYLDRPGGYTRIIRLAKHRLGDNGRLVLLQLVGQEQERKKGKKRPQRKKTHPAEKKTQAGSAAGKQPPT
jgi:large subunit ribosomal protein L17